MDSGISLEDPSVSVPPVSASMLSDAALLQELCTRMRRGQISKRQWHEASCELDPATFNYWYDLFDVGSVINQVDTIAIIQRLYHRRRPENPVRILDFGAGTCGGTALLARMFGMSGPSVLKVDVTALELPDERLQRFVGSLYPEVKLIFEDVFEHAATYDMVQASNVIEHLPDPTRYVRRLQALAHDYVMLTTPFMELDRIEGHVNFIDMPFIERYEPLEVHVYTNVGWRPRGQVVTFILPGLAKR